MTLSSNPIPADAMRAGWVDRVPAGVRPYLRLMRLDRPIGTWLLLWPCVFGLVVGHFSVGPGLEAWRDGRLLLLFCAGSIVMRGAGCTLNDIVDRDIDAQVARTRGRPIASGSLSVARAMAFLLAQFLVGLAILVQLNLFAVILGASSLVLVAIYPYMKRITWWPQAWLGLTFNWGALLGFAAETGHLRLPAYLLYAGCFFWTLGYDTIYALQDVDDDALIGVKSTARLFGVRAPRFVTYFYALAWLLMAASGLAAGMNWALVVALLPAGLHFAWQVGVLDPSDGGKCLKVFRSNRDIGFLIATALVVGCYSI